MTIVHLTCVRIRNLLLRAGLLLGPLLRLAR